MSDHPDHDPGAALDLIRAAHREGGHRLTDREVIEVISRQICILDGSQPLEWSGKGRKPKKTRWEYSAELRRGVYHRLIRLPEVRARAETTRRKSGDVSRAIVFGLCLEARENGTSRRNFRKEVKRLATAKRQRIPADWQLGKIIREFFKVDTTT